MKEKNDELINNMLRSKFNWWHRLWEPLINFMKVKNKDFSYQEYLDSIRKVIVKKNSEEDSKDATYQVYLDRVKKFSEARGVRLLTEQEEAIVVNHLEGVALAYANDPNNSIRAATGEGGVERVGVEGSLSIIQVLCIETAKKVSEIHEEFPEATSEVYDRKVVEVLAIQNYLKQQYRGRE